MQGFCDPTQCGGHGGHGDWPMFELSKAYKARGMAGFSELQQREFSLQNEGFKAVKHQSFVGTGYFDSVQNTIQSSASTMAMKESTEAQQFH